MALFSFKHEFTAEEWKKLEDMANDKKISLTQFFLNEINKKFYNDTVCVPCSQKPVPKVVKYLSVQVGDDTLEKLKCRANGMGLKPSRAIARLILNDLLK